METARLYGIGKGDAQVFDGSGLIDLAQEENRYNRKLNAEKAAKKAVGSAKLNDSYQKLNKQVWAQDNEHMAKMIQDTENFMTEAYNKGGETALYDNPELKKEFQGRLSKMKNFAEMSRSQQAMGNKQITERAKDVEDLDYESAVAFDDWLSLPSEQRAVTTMPMVGQRLKTTGEAVTKYAKPQLTGLLKEYKSDGAVDDETGEYTTYEGQKLDVTRLNTLGYRS